MLGIDLGITSLITTSYGETFANPKNLQKLDKKLRLAQKSLDRKTKRTNNYEKARLKVARIRAKIKDSRLEMTQKLTTQLIKRYQTIVVEEMAVKNMVKNHTHPHPLLGGEQEGWVSDANWRELVRQIEYKAEWYGRKLVKIDRYFPSSSGGGKRWQKAPNSNGRESRAVSFIATLGGCQPSAYYLLECL